MTAKIVKLGVACAILMLAAGTTMADPLGGTIGGKYVAKAHTTDVFTVKLMGQETTRIRLVGDGDTCLELRVYDENGFLVATDTLGFSDIRQVYIKPKWTGKFRIEVSNIGSLPNQYVLVLD